MTVIATRDRVAATARAVRWTVPLAAFGLVVVLLVWRRLDLATESGALGLSRVIGVLLVVGVLPLLDDPAARQVAAVPLPLWVREAPRLITMVVLVLVPVWVLALETGLPTAAVLLETGCILALATGAASAAAASDRSGGALHLGLGRRLGAAGGDVSAPSPVCVLRQPRTRLGGRACPLGGAPGHGSRGRGGRSPRPREPPTAPRVAFDTRRSANRVKGCIRRAGDFFLTGLRPYGGSIVGGHEGNHQC